VKRINRWWILVAIVVVVVVGLALNPEFQAGLREGLRGAGR
jgi:hypothetical protein